MSMKEIKGNLFDYPVICITTNSVLNEDNKLVMGKGIALTAKRKFKDIDLHLGLLVKSLGNVPHLLQYSEQTVISFPTKYHWNSNSDLKLIEQSAQLLLQLTNLHKLDKVYLPKVGCGCGNLKWSIVEPILDKHLDYRFIIVSNYTYYLKCH